jgi:hypothetical protein
LARFHDAHEVAPGVTVKKLAMYDVNLVADREDHRSILQDSHRLGYMRDDFCSNAKAVSQPGFASHGRCSASAWVALLMDRPFSEVPICLPTFYRLVTRETLAWA